MKKFKQTLVISSSPHLSSGASVEIIMRNVVYALLPVVAFAVYLFGVAAAISLLTAVVSTVVFESLFCRLSQQQTTVSDWSAVITGLLYGLTLPPGLPLWMVVIGALVAIALGKFLFGGLGFNPFNPALVGRAFLQAAFPSAMTTWAPALSPERFNHIPSSLFAFPFTHPHYDVISEATPLAAMKFAGQQTDVLDLMLGVNSGSLGETSSVVIFLAGLYLIARNMMSWRIPLGIFVAVGILSGIFHLLDPAVYPTVLFMFFSGGLMLGAMFMATDMVASPITAWGCFVYGILIGCLVVIIRLWGGMPEGVMYAILIANAFSPHIDKLIQPKVFGSK